MAKRRRSNGNTKSPAAGLAEALFAPRGVALIGASDDRSKPSARPLQFLRKHGFAGAIHAVNPKRQSIDGVPVHAELGAVPGPVDLAYLLVGTDRVEAAVRACGAHGISAAAVLADGYAEAGEAGAARQDRLVACAREVGVRLLGPNSLGLIVPRTGLALSANAALAAERLIPGRLALVSQSGSILGTLLSRVQARGLGFSKMVSVGNEADLSIGEIGLLLAADPETDAILLFLESIRHAEAMAGFAAAAQAAGKPMIAYLLGRSNPGRAAALSHTGAIVGSDAAADAFLSAHGIMRVDHLEALFEVAPLAIGRKPGTVRGAAAVVTTTGGGGAMAADRLGLAGVPVQGLSEETAARLRKSGIPVRAGRIIDVTLAGTRPEVMRAALDAALKEPGIGLALAVIGSSAQFHPALASEAVAGYAGSGKPVAAFVVPEAPATMELLARAGIAAFRTPEACADAIRALMRWAMPTQVPSADPPADAARVIDAATTNQLNAVASFDLIAALGIDAAPAAIVDAGGLMPELPFDFPVAVKAQGIAHKTEVGGVRLGVRDAKALKRAVAEIARSAGVKRVLLQPMVDGLGEVLLGFRREPGVGPVVAVGTGGVLAEIYGDTAVRLAPIDERQAREMIEEVKGLAPLRGYRGLPKGDLDALAAAVAAFSTLAALPIAEAEINPLIVRKTGVVAVDALVRRMETLND